MREPNGFVLNHCHGTQRIRLELHGSLLEPRSVIGTRTGPLVVRPWLGVVRGLREICDRGFDGVSRYGGLGRVGRSDGGRGRQTDETPAGAGENPPAAEHVVCKLEPVCETLFGFRILPKMEAWELRI